MRTVINYLRCWTFYNAAPAPVAVCAEVILMRKVQGSGPPPRCWCHSPADSCHKHLKSPQTWTSLPNGLISFNHHLTEKSDCWHTAGQLSEKSGSLCYFVSSHIKLHRPSAAPPRPCSLVSVRARGQVLSHGRHNWPNDWQVDTRAELWLWLPTWRFRGAHCANRTLSCDYVHTDKRKEMATHDKGFFLKKNFSNILCHCFNDF